MIEEFDRQIRAIGEQNQIKIQGLTVTVVGAGGTGSPVAVQLARMGRERYALLTTTLLKKQTSRGFMARGKRMSEGQRQRC